MAYILHAVVNRLHKIKQNTVIDMKDSQSNKKYLYAFVVVRWTDFGPGRHFDDISIDIPKMFWTQELADAEAERLNTLNGQKGVRYFVRMTRVSKGI